jgi:hypothetical protein
MALLKSKTKLSCPCCASCDFRWLYRVQSLFYCVECLRSIWGKSPARIAREH